MQYSATAFAMPINRVFKIILRTDDWIWQYIYLSFDRYSFSLSRIFAKLQGGNVRIYLGYTFVTLILLLWTVTC